MADELRICIDRSVAPELRFRARQVAEEENPANLEPPEAPGEAPAPRSGAVDRSKKWKPGRILRVRFLDGDAAAQARVAEIALEWTRYANIRFEFGDDPAAEIRISFSLPGSWSYVGTDALLIPQSEPTMNYGWLTSTTDDVEASRVVLHEFGHALGMIHEHQNPINGIRWNRDAVLRYYMGPPNNWRRDQVESNVLETYSQDLLEYTSFDPDSIMLYPVPKEFTLDGFERRWQNSQLSEVDKTFIAGIYPYPT